MDKAMSYLGLARKAGLAELGEEPVEDISRTRRAYLIIVAGDASDHTWRKAKSLVDHTEMQCVRVPWSKADMGMAAGRTELAIAAITDPALALALLRNLPENKAIAAACQVLELKAQRQEKHREEEKAHRRNVRFGKKKT